MDLNPDFRDLFAELNAAGAKYLVIGGYAVIYYAEPRYTKDIDLLIESSPENAEKVWIALAAFGAPMRTLSRDDLQTPEMVVQIGIAPNRIDLLTSVKGVEFKRAWEQKVCSQYGDQKIWILDLESLILAKQAAGRPQDLADLASLQAVRDLRE